MEYFKSINSNSLLLQVVPDPYKAPFIKSRRIVWTGILIFTQVIST